MAKLSSTDEPVTKAELAEFYQQIFPFLGGNKAVASSPIGTVISYMGATPPAGYLACDGSKLSATAFPLLFNVLKTLPSATRSTWGDADWTTEFNVPNLQGEFLRGTGTNSHTNQGNGAGVGVHQDGTYIPDYGSNASATLIAQRMGTNNENNSGNQDKLLGTSTRALTVTGTLSTESWTQNNATGFSARPTNTSVLYCIKYTYVTQEVEYSPQERVVGKWRQMVDGVEKWKPLYEKTIVGETSVNEDAYGSTVILVAENIANQHIIDSTITYTDGNYFRIAPIHTYTSGSYDGVTAYMEGGYLIVRRIDMSINANTPFDVTVQYTKTTDSWQV